ncbi:hypothetical protein S40293_11361 [Stachybotrys chartarum IBT 40293]|nr:hypothetical protein S40293_11361 [Stachybotrys chartarum IBT 40293]
MAEGEELEDAVCEGLMVALWGFQLACIEARVGDADSLFFTLEHLASLWSDTLVDVHDALGLVVECSEDGEGVDCLDLVDGGDAGQVHLGHGNAELASQDLDVGRGDSYLGYNLLDDGVDINTAMDKDVRQRRQSSRGWHGDRQPRAYCRCPGPCSYIVCVALFTLLANLTATMFAPGVENLADEFDLANSTVVSMTVSIYVVGFALGPLVLAARRLGLYAGDIVTTTEQASQPSAA